MSFLMPILCLANLSAQVFTCQNSTNVPLNATCSSILTPSTFGASSTDATVTIKDGLNILTLAQGFTNNGTASVTVSQLPTYQSVGKTYTCELTQTVAPFAKCFGIVKFEDKIAPIAFGRDTIVSCGTPTSATAWLIAYNLPLKTTANLLSASNPGYFDNCGAKLSATQVGSIDNCGNGMRTKIFTVTDNQTGVTATTNVRYISENRSAFSIEFPDDVELICSSGVGNTSFATSPNQTGKPILTNYAGTCPLVGMEYKDDVISLQNTNQGCYRILRTWKTLNWCQPLPVNLALASGTGNSKPTDPKTTVVRTGTQAVFRKFYSIDILRPDRINSVLDPNAPFYNLMSAASASYPVGYDTDSYMEYTQIIKVIDTTVPTITKGNVTLEPIAKECRVKLVVEKPTADDCTGVASLSYQLVNASNVIVGAANFTPSSFVQITNFGGTGELPFGKYIVRYIAVDNCGNFASSDVAIDVKDVKKPVSVSFQGLSVDLVPATSNVTIGCNVFNAGSYDNCPGVECFLQTPSPGPNQPAPLAANIDASANGTTTMATPTKLAKNATFNCVGYQTVALWIRDASGNWEYSETYVDVQNNFSIPNIINCIGDPILGLKVSANVKTEAGKPAKAQVSVFGTGFTGPLKKWTQTTGMSYPVAVPNNSKVEVSAYNNTYPLNGVSSFDLVLIAKHVLGTQLITSKYAKIAADVNNNGTISTADLIELRKMILGININFVNNTSWRFFTNPFLEKAIIDDIQKDTVVSFTAIKIGDINGSADPTLAIARSATNFNVADANIKTDEEIKVVINNKNAEGFQFALNYDVSALELLQIDENSAALQNGIITTAQVGTDFVATFKAKKNAILSNVISLGTAIPSEAVVDGKSTNISFNFDNTEAKTNFELAQNQPNPFRGATVISFQTPESGAYILTISDLAGRIVKSISATAEKGTNNVNVEMKSAGVFNYTVKMANFTATKKMVVAE